LRIAKMRKDALKISYNILGKNTPLNPSKYAGFKNAITLQPNQ